MLFLSNRSQVPVCQSVHLLYATVRYKWILSSLTDVTFKTKVLLKYKEKVMMDLDLRDFVIY